MEAEITSEWHGAELLNGRPPCDMLFSENINEIAKALSLVQSKIGKASKDKDNPFFKKKYADLESIWDVARDILPEFGLAVAQLMGGTAANPVVITLLIHISGQWFQGRHQMQSRKPEDPQVVGSLITYGRRYGLAAILGIVQSDDDGNLGSRGDKDKIETNEEKVARWVKSPSDKSPVKKPQEKRAEAQEKAPFKAIVPLSRARQDQIAAQCDDLPEDVAQEFLDRMGVKSFSDLGKLESYTEAVKTIAELKNKQTSDPSQDDIPF